MSAVPVLLDTDTLSEISRGHPAASVHARAYLARFGRFTITSITVFERLRGYRQAIAKGKPYQRHLHAFEALVESSVVLPFDEIAADVAATIWSTCSRAQRSGVGDILIAATAVARQIPLATRNRKDFTGLCSGAGIELELVDWTKPGRPSS
jgi:predicted nucleic acid-binding protein